jgi:hypothetical protein
MENLTWALPILPGQLEAWNAFLAEMHERMDEHVASRREMGAHREVASLMQTPGGDFVCVYLEADDMAGAFRVLATSTSPYLEWFRQKGAEIHGMTPEMLTGPLPSEVKFDWKG